MEYGDYLRLIGTFILFLVILYGAYYVSRILGSAQMKRSKGQNMTVIEVLPVGQQKTLQLVRVGKEYLIIGVTRDRITFVQSIDASGIDLAESKENIVPFSSFLNKLIHKEDHKEDDNSLGEELDEQKKK